LPVGGRAGDGVFGALGGEACPIGGEAGLLTSTDLGQGVGGQGVDRGQDDQSVAVPAGLGGGVGGGEGRGLMKSRRTSAVTPVQGREPVSTSTITPYGLSHQVSTPGLLAAAVFTYDPATQMSLVDGTPSHLHPQMATTKVTPLGTGQGSKSDESD